MEEAVKRVNELGPAMGVYSITVMNRVGAEDIPARVKADIPNRLVFKVTSAQDSKLAGVKGAENLRVGEALYRDGEHPEGERIKTLFASEINVKKVAQSIKGIAFKKK